MPLPPIDGAQRGRLYKLQSARRPRDASQPMERTRDDARWSPAGFHCAAPEPEHVWQMPAPVRRLDKANRRLRRMLERHLSPGVMRGIATLVTTDAVLTTVCVLARALPHATRSAKVCLRRTQMSPVLDREAVVDSTLVVDSTRDTRIFTIGVDLSTLTWYIRQGALKRRTLRPAAVVNIAQSARRVFRRHAAETIRCL